MPFSRARAVLISAALLALSVGTARADVPARLPRATLVQVLSHGKQALLLDRQSGEFTVVKVGDSLQGFRVSDIENDQIVLSSGEKPERFFVLPLVRPGDVGPRAAIAAGGSSSGAGGGVVDPYAPDGGASARIPSVSASGAGAGGVVDPYDAGTGSGAMRIPSVSASGAGAGGVVDPYGAGIGSSTSASGPSAEQNNVVDPYDGAASSSAANRPAGAGGVVDPYGPAAPVRSVEAPPASRAASSPAAPSSTAAPSPPAPSPSASMDSPAGAGATTAAAAVARPIAPADASSAAPALGAGRSTRPARAGEEHRRLSRRELDHALADFAALAKEVQIEHARGGGVLIRQIGRGSFFARLGLEPGDIVRKVAGHTIDTADDAADAYAAVESAHDVVVEIDRRGVHVRLHLDLVD